MRPICTYFCLTAVFAAAAVPTEHTFELSWQEHSCATDISVKMDRSTPFAVEPDIADRTVFRGTLSVGRDEAGAVGFLWDKDKGLLYVDLNRDGDLTNDPDGQYASGEEGGSWQSFSDIELEIARPTGVFKYRLEAYLRGFSSYKYAEFRILSGYQGACDLYGRTWTFRVNDNLDGQIRPDDKFSIHCSDPNASEIMGLYIPRSLYLDGRCYDLNFAFKQTDDGPASLWCTLTERDVPLGTLVFTGKYLSHLVIGNATMLILPQRFDEPVQVPAGDYTLRQLMLKPNDTDATITPAYMHRISVSIPEGGTAELAVGGPLKSSVAVKRKGTTLEFSYQLVGTGGETYDARAITNYNNTKTPSVAIYKGDLQLASGTFEYG